MRNEGLVRYQSNRFQCRLRLLSRHLRLPEVEKHEMVVGTSGDQAMPGFLKGLSEGAGIVHDLLAVRSKPWTERFPEGDGLGENLVHKRSPLHVGEHGLVDGS